MTAKEELPKIKGEKLKRQQQAARQQEVL